MKNKHPKLTKALVVFSTSALLFISILSTSVFATSQDTTSHRPYYTTATFDGDPTFTFTNEYGNDRENVNSFVLNGNTTIPYASILTDDAVRTENTITADPVLPTGGTTLTIPQTLIYSPGNKYSDTAIPCISNYNLGNANGGIYKYLAEQPNKISAIGAFYPDIYIPIKDGYVNWYAYPSLTININGLPSDSENSFKYVWYNYSTTLYNSEGVGTSKSYTDKIAVYPNGNGGYTFPLIPVYMPDISETGVISSAVISTIGDGNDIINGVTTVHNIVKASSTTTAKQMAKTLVNRATNAGGYIHLSNLTIMVQIPSSQKDDLTSLNDSTLEYTSIYYKSNSGTAVSNMQTHYSVYYQRALATKFIPEYTDSDWFGWIVDSIAAFLDIKILPNLTIGTVFGLMFSVPLLILVLRSFDGG